MRTEIFRPPEGSVFPSSEQSFFLRRKRNFPALEKEFSSVGKDVFPRRKESLRSKGKDLRRVLKKANREAGYTRPPIRFFRCSTAKSGATPVEGRWKCYCFFSGVGLVMKTRLSAGTRALIHCWSLACSGTESALPDSTPRSTAM